MSKGSNRVLFVFALIVLIMVGGVFASMYLSHKDQATLQDSPIYTGIIDKQFVETSKNTDQLITNGNTTMFVGGSDDTTFHVLINEKDFDIDKSTWITLKEGMSISYQVTKGGRIGNIQQIKDADL